MMRTLLDWLL